MPRFSKENLTKTGSIALLLFSLGHGIATTAERASNQPGISGPDLLRALNPIEMLIPREEYAFIVRYLHPYLNEKSANQIVKIAQECAQINQSENETVTLAFFGVPLYGSHGDLDSFLPIGISCGTHILSREKTLPGGYSLEVPSIESQLLALSMNMTHNTLEATAPGSPPVLFSFDKDQLFMSIVPAWGVQEDGTLVGAHESYKASKSYYSLQNREDFLLKLREAFRKEGVCPFVPPQIAAQRVEAYPEPIAFVNPNDGEEWFLTVCRNLIKQMPQEQLFQIDITKFPDNVKKAINAKSTEKFPVKRDKDGNIILRLDTDEGKKFITLYSEKSPTIPTIMGATETQIKTDPVKPAPFPPGYLADIAAGLLGGVGLGWSLRADRLKRKKLKPALDHADIMAKINAQLEESRKKQPVQRSVEGRKIEAPVVQERPFVVRGTDQESSEPVVLSNAEEFFAHLKSKVTNTEALQRLEASRSELIGLGKAAMTVEPDFRKFFAYVEGREKRIEKWRVGGDSITLSYSIVNEAKNAVGYLWIDLDLEKEELEVKFYEEDPTPQSIQQEQAKHAGDTLFEEEVVGEEVSTVEEAAYLLSEYILSLLTTTELSEENFLAIRNQVKFLGEKNKTYSLVKEEVKRILTEQITSNQIPISFDDRHSKKSASLHPRIMADRIYDYFCESMTYEGNYEHFTSEALNFLNTLQETEGITVIEQTAGKAWNTRTGYRIQCIQALKEGKRRVIVLFTHHFHKG